MLCCGNYHYTYNIGCCIIYVHVYVYTCTVSFIKFTSFVVVVNQLYTNVYLLFRLNKIQWNLFKDFEISFRRRCPLFRSYLLYSWIVLYCIGTKTSALSMEVSFNSECPVFSLFIGWQKVVVSFSRIQLYTSSLLRYCIHNWIPTLGSYSMAKKCSLCWVYQPNVSHSRMRVMVKGVASQAR